MEDRIIEALKKHHKLTKIAKVCHLDKKTTKSYLRQLINKKIAVEYYENYYLLHTGILEITNEHFGFITPNDIDQTEDYYVSSDSFNGAFDGDLVRFYIYKEPRNNRFRADIVEIIEHTKTELVGYLRINEFKERKNYNLISLDKKMIVKVIKDTLPALFNGAIIRAKLNYTNKTMTASFIELIGYKDDPGIEIATIAATYGFSKTFPQEVIDEVANIPQVVTNNEYINRKDFRDLPIITIDGDSSKDFDDAIYVKKETDNTYTLGVYIADVSNYVLFNKPLDKEAYKRGTSVYLADRVIPMLPRELSNGICSLNEGEDRLVLAIIMKINSKGQVVDSNLCEGVIKSRHRMTYTKVNKILNDDKDLITEYSDIYQMLLEANELHKIIRAQREASGSLDFDIDEYEFILNEDGSPKDIIKRTRYDAEKLIEDFMIVANEEVAKYMSHLDLPFLYRVHDKPVEQKVIDFMDYIGETKKIKQNKEIYPKDVQTILKKLEDKPEGHILNQLLLRAMAKAKYSSRNIGHYGLALKKYCHFTSPIRRYPDLIVHRIIKELILHPEHYESRYKYYANNLEEIGLNTSNRERNAISCERDTNDMLYAWYMEKHINETYTGYISAVTNFGLFVTIDKGVEGLIHIRNLVGNYSFNEKTMQLVGYNRTFSLGDKVEVVVMLSDRYTKKIDFMLKEDYEEVQTSENSSN